MRLFALLLLPAAALAQAPGPRVGTVWIVPNQNALRFEIIDQVAPITRLEVARTPEISVSWPVGKIATQDGEKIEDSGAAEERAGRFGRVLTSSFSFAVPAAKEPAWFAVTLWDGQAEQVQIDAAGAKISFPLEGSQRWVTRAFPLKETGPIVFHEVKGNGEESVLLGGASVFRAKNFDATHLVELGATSERAVVTALAQQCPWDPKFVRHFLLSGVDKVGTRAAPVAADTGVGPTSTMFLYPQAD